MESKTKSSRVQVTDPFAEVRVSPVRVNGSPVLNKGIEIMTEDGWECINIHSAAYQLVPNEVVASVTQEILGGSDLEWNQVNQVWTGRYFAQLFMSSGVVEVPEVGDALCLGLRSENSYDGSCQFRLILQAFVLSCSNGLVSPRHFRSFAMKHQESNHFNVEDAVNVIGTGLNLLEQIVPKVTALSRIPLSIDLLARVAQETHLPKREWGFVNENLGGVSDLWGLMQAITNRLTHHGRGRAGLLSQETVGDYFMDHILRDQSLLIS
jgi:hypothetical protein